MTLYDDLQGVAAEVLTEFGQGSLQYVKVTPGNGPVDDPGPSVETIFSTVGAVRGVMFKYVAGGQASSSDLQATIPHSELFTPELNAFLRVDGVPYKIVSIIPKPAAGTVVVNTLIIRK